MYRLSQIYPRGFDALKVFSTQTLNFLSTAEKYIHDTVSPIEEGKIAGFSVLNSRTGANHTVSTIIKHGNLWKCNAGFVNPEYMIISDHEWKFARPSYLLHDDEKVASGMMQNPVVGWNDWVAIYLPPFHKDD